ncbi:MAG: DUF2281 domain-containing protein [Pseudanabaenaceae cyanobacterium]|jgi:hypothetical protein
MQTTAAIEQTILNNIRQLPPEKQQEVLDFTETLRKKFAPKNKLSMRQIAKLPLAQRHQYLAQYIPATAQDFYNDLELTEFSVLDTADWESDHD